MNVKTTLIAASLAAWAAAGSSALAADTVPALSDAAPPAQVQPAANTDPAPKVTPHSHVQDKHGVAATPPEEPARKGTPPKTLHFHPRDGK